MYLSWYELSFELAAVVEVSFEVSVDVEISFELTAVVELSFKFAEVVEYPIVSSSVGLPTVESVGLLDVVVPEITKYITFIDIGIVTVLQIKSVV